MTMRDDDFTPRPGRIRHGNRGAKRPKSFAGEVMRAANKAGHRGTAFRPSSGTVARSTFGRGRRAALSLASRSPSRRVVVMARIVRHRGGRLRSAPLSKHVAYLKREGVTRDGADARMFDATSDNADTKAFAQRCEEDRHHFRFTVSPEDAIRMADLRAFTRELMADAESDLGAKLDWVAVDHWNTDNPHIHVLVRGRTDDGQDLVISRDYISNGFRGRAGERVTLELGLRSEREIRDGLKKEVDAERWTSLDRSLRDISDEGGGVIDLRPVSAGEDPELRRLMIGRAAQLERLGLAEQVGPAQWTLKPGIEPALRDFGIRGDIIRTMHRAVSAADRQPDVAGFALHGDEGSEPVLGRLVERGLHDELKGTAYAIIDGVDGPHAPSRLLRLGDDRGRQTRSHRRNADLRRRRRQQAPVARHPIGPHCRGAGRGLRRDLDRPRASRQGVLPEQQRLRRRRPGGNGPPDRSSHRTGSGSTARSAGYLRS
jgi:type IV secretory pathway VirD2 relaxase